MMVGGGWISRRWLPWRYAELCDKLIQNKDVEICFIGGAPGGSSEDGLIGAHMSEPTYSAS
ncbi:hypothetical protein, partial [uncultured Gordonia sp.]|uniref:hypothetical protein n=1 Tax=uncultured Gordonia sp. TaxID=198437 RepID=UPI002589448F